MHTKSNHTELKHILTGSAIGLLFFVVVSFIAAFILTKSDLGYHTVRYAVCMATAVSAFLAGFVSKKQNRMKGILCGALSGGVVLAVEFAAVLLFCGLEIRGESFLLIPAALVSGMLGGVIASNVR